MLSQTHQISDVTLMNLQRIVRVQYKTDLIAKSILELLQATFGNGTLAQLDKRFVTTGESAQITEISKQSIRTVLGREYEESDKEMLVVAWQSLYQQGLATSVFAS
jgi:hypothetical protein